MQFFNYVMRKGNYKFCDVCSQCILILWRQLIMSLLDLLFDSERNNTDVFFCISSPAVWLHQTRIGLSLYDVAGQGYLRESVSNLI